MAGRASYTVRYAPIAETQIDAALLWWARNRRLAPGMLAREIERALEEIEVVPQSGRKVRLRGCPGARRLLLPRTQFHIYYVVFEVEREVRIVYFRHGRRRPLKAV